MAIVNQPSSAAILPTVTPPWGSPRDDPPRSRPAARPCRHGLHRDPSRCRPRHRPHCHQSAPETQCLSTRNHSPAMRMPDKNSRNVTDPLAQLNQAQRAAVTFGIDQHPAAAGSDHPPLLVIAGAGSGKTSTLAHRVAQIVSQGTDPGRILLLTFSRRAASEMTRRVERILSQPAPDRGRAGLVRHLPQRRRAPAARVRRPHWSRSGVHHP